MRPTDWSFGDRPRSLISWTHASDRCVGQAPIHPTSDRCCTSTEIQGCERIQQTPGEKAAGTQKSELAELGRPNPDSLKLLWHGFCVVLHPLTTRD